MSLKHVAESGTLAEEVISTVRTAHAFGTQKVLSSLYDVHVKGAQIANAKAAIFHGGTLGVIYFVIYSGYALGMSFRPSFTFLLNSLQLFNSVQP
jgi:ATP-binding cassette subfamily B (MDR/TAP) protein 1